MIDWIINTDWSVLQWIQAHCTGSFMDLLMPKITMLGDAGIIWILAAILLICVKKFRRYGVLLLAGLVIGVLLGNVALKNIIARPRPCWTETGVKLLIANPTDYSFPSGHTLSSVIGATMLTMINKKLGLVAIPLAVLIAFSRLYLFVHYPSDLIGAAILGIGIGVFAFVDGNKLFDIVTMRMKKKEQQ